MYVTKRGNKFRAWERVVIDGVPHKFSVTMDRDTPQSRNKAQEALKKKISMPSASIRYSDLVKLYIDYQKMTCKASTWTRNQSSLERLAEVFGNARLDAMNAGFISSSLMKKTRNPGTFNEYLKRIKAMFRWAYRNDYISSTACIDKIKPMKDLTDREKVADKFLEADELKKVISESSDYCGLIFEFLALSGLRIGELIALNDEDVTETDIIVKATYDYRNGIITTPKTSAGCRQVHIQPELANCIKRLRALSNQHRLISRRRPPYFVVNAYGGRLSYVNTNRTFKSLCTRLTGKPLTLHALRHTHVALMAQNGADLKAISRRIGHEDSELTERIYYHVTKKQQEKDNAAFDSISIFA